MTTIALRLVVGTLLLLGTVGCAGPALQANMTDAQYRAVLAGNFPTGTSLDGVKTELKTLHVSQDFAHLYPPEGARPEVYLVRTYPPTGPWPQFGADSNVEFVDVSFVFGPDGGLRQSLIYRDGIRYGNGMVMDGPNRPTLIQNPGKWTVGPPADPLEGAF